MSTTSGRPPQRISRYGKSMSVSASSDSLTIQRDALQQGAEITQLRRELDERPVNEVEKWVDADELEEAHELARRAYGSREYAFRQLCFIHMNHHELRGERCSCGRSITDCDLVGIVEGYTALPSGERAQEEREACGLAHQLPYEYVRKLGRRATDDNPREFDPYPYGSTGRRPSRD